MRQFGANVAHDLRIGYNVSNMTPMPELRKSERIQMIIAKANQLAAIEWLQAVLEEQAQPLRDNLAALQVNGTAAATVAEFKTIVQQSPAPTIREIAAPAFPSVKPKKKRPKKSTSAGVKSYWARMTPEERRAEMQRRMQVHRGTRVSRRKR